MSSDGSKKHVVIVGGGFAGLACARKLAKSDEVGVTLIDKNNFHQFQPLLYQLATSELGTGDVATSLRQALHGHPNVDVKMGEVTSRRPHDSNGDHQARRELPGGLPGAGGRVAGEFLRHDRAQRRTPFRSTRLEEAQRLRSRILTVFEDADRDPKLLERGALNFVIVGGGPTGTEMAGALADMIRGAMMDEYPDLAVKQAQVYLVDHGKHCFCGVFREGPRLCRPDSAAKGSGHTVGHCGEGGGARSCTAFRRHVDSNAHGGLGRRADGLAFGGKCRAAAGARRPDRSAAGSHGGGLPRCIRAGRFREHSCRGGPAACRNWLRLRSSAGSGPQRTFWPRSPVKSALRFIITIRESWR